MASSELRLPQARTRDLITQQVENELVVYDRIQDKAHVLNSTAALVWRNCDGKHTVAQLAELVARETGAAPQEQVVWYTLARLQEQGLVETSVVIPAATRGMTRRDFITKFAVAAAVVPVIKTIQAPTPQQIGSCVQCGSLAPVPCCPPAVCTGTVCVDI